ncbi:hypothetical protein DUI87_30315 [Hirundo rustica rustica]|uniref:Uncharacterized protein n=1 Tax=Hirundo rustica rustica TaxID=333673 RepID=A0A3M0J2J0_HIRRU|nr:hypothetical protein DUI87_30315 [Hirundo rustica rustica]
MLRGPSGILESQILLLEGKMKNSSENLNAEHVIPLNPFQSPDESHVTFDVDSFTKALDRILGNQRQEQKVSPGELVGSLKAYMNEMDHELAQTNVGKSFTTQKRGASSVEAATSESAGPDSGAEDAELAPVDADMNLVANLLESYSAQAGLAGPTSNILQSMGVNLPENTDFTGSSS